MQKKQKREQDDEGPSHAPPIGRSNSHLEEESDTELQHKVSRFTFGFLEEHLPDISSRNLLLYSSRTKI
jgi:hypothetical protein